MWTIRRDATIQEPYVPTTAVEIRAVGNRMGLSGRLHDDRISVGGNVRDGKIEELVGRHSVLRQRRGHRVKSTPEGPGPDHPIQLDQVSFRFGLIAFGKRLA